MRIPARIYQMTMVEYQRKCAPPWRNGNCFSLAPAESWTEAETAREEAQPKLGSTHWLVLNMHAENFHALVEDAGFQEIELELVGEKYCLITDRRVNREWLRSAPCAVCVPEEVQTWVKSERRELFWESDHHKKRNGGE